MTHRSARRGATLASLALAILGFAGCASHPSGDGAHRVTDHFKPKVSIKSDVVSVSPDPMVFLPGEKGEIVWELERGYTFPDNGIQIDGRVVRPLDPKNPARLAQGAGIKELIVLDREQHEIVDCKRSDDGRSFRCRNVHGRPGVYKYTIRVQAGGRLLVNDPTLMND